MTERSIVLPSGLRLHRRGDSIETIASKALSVGLLMSREGLEIHEGTLCKGERLHLGVDAAHTSSEFYYVLSGTLRCDLPAGDLVLEPGDYLTTTEASENVTILSAVSDVRFLYMTTQPYFHTISQRLKELKDLAVEVEAKDGYTAEHCKRIQSLAYVTGQELGLSQERLSLLSYGAYLHDVGKAKVPESILQKPSALSDEEWKIMKRHPVFGRELLEDTLIADAGVIVEQHHERLDGSGYPQSLQGEAILEESYVVAVVDTYDAMTTDRPYRKGLSPKHAFDELTKFADVHYPRYVVEAFIRAVTRKTDRGVKDT